MRTRTRAGTQGMSTSGIRSMGGSMGMGGMGANVRVPGKTVVVDAYAHVYGNTVVTPVCFHAVSTPLVVV